MDKDSETLKGQMSVIRMETDENECDMGENECDTDGNECDTDGNECDTDFRKNIFCLCIL